MRQLQDKESDMKKAHDGKVGSLAMDRRQFLMGGVAAAAVAVAGQAPADGGAKAEKGGEAAKGALGPLIVSAPVLQNAAETSIGVAFAVSADASGWVEYSTSPKLAGAKRAYSGAHGLMTVDDRVALVRLRGLRPATRYYYRVGADRIEYKGGYKMKNLGPEVDPKVHSFTTLGAGAKGSFCVINDTHDRKEAVGPVLAALKKLKPAVVVWNGDASNTSETIDAAIGIFLRPHPDHPGYAADTPYMFLNGNHDYRGRFNRRLGELMMYREPTERAPEFEELGRNFVQRLGDVALIGLDTGEDKLDTNPKFAGIFRMKEYRELQTRWLAKAVETPAVKTARYRVAFCHIPLFDPRPDENPGDLAPADTAPGYKRDWAAWQRTCAKMWGPIFEKAGVELLVCGHQHRFRYNPGDKSRPWAQVVGGGPETSEEAVAGGSYPTVIEGRVEGGALVVKVHDALRGRVAKTFTVSPARI